MKYRIGRKQSLALLTVEGSKEVAMFNRGQEKLAQLVCDLLNQHSANTVSFSLRFISREFNTKRQTFFFLIFLREVFILLITLFGSYVFNTYLCRIII